MLDNPFFLIENIFSKTLRAIKFHSRKLKLRTYKFINNFYKKSKSNFTFIIYFNKSNNLFFLFNCFIYFVAFLDLLSLVVELRILIKVPGPFGSLIRRSFGSRLRCGQFQFNTHTWVEMTTN